MSTTTTTDVALKIKKLLELANKNSSEDEANLAMSKAQELMAKFNLNMAQVGAAQDGKTVTESADIKRVKEQHTRGAMYEYQQRLWATVASVNYCWHWLVPVYKSGRKVTNHHYLVGREVNVISAKLMGDYLEQAINRLCPWQGRECLSRSAISWKEGCASRLQSRLRDRFDRLQEESIKAAEGTLSLTLYNVQEAESNGNYAFLYGQDELAKLNQRRAARADAVVNALAEKAETNAQRKKREAREVRESERYQRKQEKYWERRDLNAWHMGREKAGDIGLEDQVKSSKGERSIE